MIASDSMTQNHDQTAGEVAVPTFDFAHLQIEHATARLDLPLVSPGAYLVCAPAMELNRGYRDGLLALAGARQRLVRVATGNRAKHDEDLEIEDDLKLFPRHVIRGWGGIVDRKTGEPVPFTPTNCEAFLRALPRWLFNRVRIFCLKPDNFVTAPDELPPGDTEKLVGN